MPVDLTHGTPKVSLPLTQAVMPYELKRYGQAAFEHSIPVRARLRSVPLGQAAKAVVPEPASVEAIRARVAAALADPAWDFRSAGRIAQELAVDPDTVVGVLSDPSIARQPFGMPSSDLYTEASRPVKLREVAASVQAIIAKRT